MVDFNDLPSKRKIPRLTINIPLEYSMSDNISIYVDETGLNKGTRDFSILGLCIPTNKEYKKGGLLELQLKFPKTQVKAMGKVAWSRYSGDTKEYYTGVKFIAIEDKNLDIVLDYYIDNVDWKAKDGRSFLKKVLLDIFLENII